MRGNKVDVSLPDLTQTLKHDAHTLQINAITISNDAKSQISFNRMVLTLTVPLFRVLAAKQKVALSFKSTNRSQKTPDERM